MAKLFEKASVEEQLRPKGGGEAVKERWRERMSKSILTFMGVRRVIPLVIVLALIFGWAAVAFAQTSAGGQYGNPTRTAAGNPGSSGNPSSSGGGGGGSSGGGGGGGPGGITSLPATGGPLLPLVAGGSLLVLGSAGLLALRRL